ncbi:MAG: phosphoribosyl-ATP diphosphatase [Methanobacteriaceae archaeon]
MENNANNNTNIIVNNTNIEIIKKVYSTLELRRDNPTDSYTSNIMKDGEKLGEDKILEKIGEEAAEVIIASKNNENLVEESVDLIFHTLLLLVKKEVSLEELLSEFEKRHSS